MRVGNLFILLVVGLLCMGCPDEEFQGFSGMGKRPVYVSVDELDNIENLAPQEIEQTGPIFLQNNLFFMVDLGKGIHVFDVADGQQESALTFIKIPAVSDFTVDGNTLFCDSWTDLIAIDISDIFDVQLLSRTADVFDPLLFPPLFAGIFECIDLERGAVVGWEDAMLDNALCEIFN